MNVILYSASDGGKIMIKQGIPPTTQSTTSTPTEPATTSGPVTVATTSEPVTTKAEITTKFQITAKQLSQVTSGQDQLQTTSSQQQYTPVVAGITENEATNKYGKCFYMHCAINIKV